MLLMSLLIKSGLSKKYGMPESGTMSNCYYVGYPSGMRASVHPQQTSAQQKSQPGNPDWLFPEFTFYVFSISLPGPMP